MKQHNLSSVISVVIGIILLVILNVSVVTYFIYACVTIYHSVIEILFWAIVMFSAFGTFNLFGITMIKDINNQ